MTGRRHAFTLGDVVRENARTYPGVEALTCGDVRVTFDALEGRVNRTAAFLRSRGVEPGDRVGWYGPSCHRAVELLLACAKCAAVFAPLNWRQSPGEIDWALEVVAPRLVVV